MRIRRPFQSVRGVVLLCLLAGWLLLLVRVNGYSEANATWLAAFLTGTVCILLWANHLTMAPISGTVGVLRLLGVVIYDLCVLSVLVVLLSIPFPHYDGYTPRAKVSELILAASGMRTVIAERFDSNHTLANSGLGLKVDPTPRVKSSIVTADGAIVVAGDDPPAVVFLTPFVVEGKLTWKCSGVPEKLMPMVCREP